MLEGEIFLQNLPSIITAHALGNYNGVSVNYKSCHSSLAYSTCLVIFLMHIICGLTGDWPLP